MNHLSHLARLALVLAALGCTRKIDIGPLGDQDGTMSSPTDTTLETSSLPSCETDVWVEKVISEAPGLRAVMATANNRVVAASASSFWAYDGHRWTAEQHSPLRGNAIGGIDADDFFLGWSRCGSALAGGCAPVDSILFRYKNLSVENADFGPRSFLDVWVAPTGEAFAVGRGGRILFRKDGKWTTMDSGTTLDLFGVWGASATDVFAVGGSLRRIGDKSYTGVQSVVLHYDGMIWSTLDEGDPKSSNPTLLVDVQGRASPRYEVYLVANSFTCDGASIPRCSLTRSIISQYDGGGSSIQQKRFFPGIAFASVWAAPDTTDTYVVGGVPRFDPDAAAWDDDGTIFHFLGGVSADWDDPAAAVAGIPLFAVGGTKSNDYFYSGNKRSSVADVDLWVGHVRDGLLDPDGGETDAAARASLGAIWGPPFGSIVYLAGPALRSSAGSSFTEVAIDGFSDAVSVSGGSGADIAAVGSSGTIAWNDGASWSVEVQSGVCSKTRGRMDIWAYAKDDVYVVCGGSTIRHFDGSTWSEIAISTDEWPATSDNWKKVALTAIWGLGPGQILVGGTQEDGPRGIILRYSGGLWTSFYPPTAEIRGFYGSPGGDLWAIGEDTLLHFDGKAWQKVICGPTCDKLAPNAMAGNDTGAFYLASGDCDPLCENSCANHTEGSGKLLYFNGSSFELIYEGNCLSDVWLSTSSKSVFAVGSAPSLTSPSGQVGFVYSRECEPPVQ